ncbi:hypothetical protein ROZALSC1DRAFT_26209, partial [Rozella allomycis CSF55]
DQQAKAATLTNLVHYIPTLPNPQNYYFYHNDILITQPPRTLMKQVFNTLRQNDLESKYHPDELRFISMHNSVLTCTNTDKQSDLSFRLKLLTQRLPVNDNLYRYKKLLSPICPRCKTKNETIEHIFICNHSIEVWESLIETFLLQYNTNDVLS